MSFYIIRIKGFSYDMLAQNFPIHGFGLIWKEKQYFKIFEEGMRRVERQYSLTQLFLCVASFCMTINTKNDWVGDQR